MSGIILVGLFLKTGAIQNKNSVSLLFYHDTLQNQCEFIGYFQYITPKSPYFLDMAAIYPVFLFCTGVQKAP